MSTAPLPCFSPSASPATAVAVCSGCVAPSAGAINTIAHGRARRQAVLRLSRFSQAPRRAGCVGKAIRLSGNFPVEHALDDGGGERVGVTLELLARGRRLGANLPGSLGRRPLDLFAG